MIDLDHFKPINDRAGHAAGDAMLKAVAAAITARVRASDLVVRMGGDEFALLLERCSHDTALRIAENVRRAVSDIALHLGGPGAARRRQPRRGLADRRDGQRRQPGSPRPTAACYAAKAAGRDAVQAAKRPALRVVGADATLE